MKTVRQVRGYCDPDLQTSKLRLRGRAARRPAGTAPPPPRGDPGWSRRERTRPRGGAAVRSGRKSHSFASRLANRAGAPRPVPAPGPRPRPRQRRWRDAQRGRQGRHHTGGELAPQLLRPGPQSPSCVCTPHPTYIPAAPTGHPSPAPTCIPARSSTRDPSQVSAPVSQPPPPAIPARPPHPRSQHGPPPHPRNPSWPRPAHLVAPPRGPSPRPSLLASGFSARGFWAWSQTQGRGREPAAGHTSALGIPPPGWGGAGSCHLKIKPRPLCWPTCRGPGRWHHLLRPRPRSFLLGPPASLKAPWACSTPSPTPRTAPHFPGCSPRGIWSSPDS